MLRALIDRSDRFDEESLVDLVFLPDNNMLASLRGWGTSLAALATNAAAQAKLSALTAASAENDEASKNERSSSSGDEGGSNRVLRSSTTSVAKPAAAGAEEDALFREALAASAEVSDAAANGNNKKAESPPASGKSSVPTDESPPFTIAPVPAGGFKRSIPFPEVDAATGSKPRVAMSACLLGHEVRYNKGHCHARAMTTLLGSVFQFVPVCPEMDIGLGTPRPTLRLVGDGRPIDRNTDMEDLGKHVRLFCPDTNTDFTDTMTAYAAAKVDDLQSFGCDGFVLKKDSPSCGLDRVKIYKNREPNAPGRSMYVGIFARALVSAWPELPVTEEGRLCDEDTRDNFVRQVICHHQWRATDGSFAATVKFHETNKFVLLAQDPATLKELGRFLAKGKQHFAANDGAAFYYRRFFAAMKILVGRGRHVNVLQHLCGYVKNDADAELYASLLDAIADYKDGLVPLIVPLTLLQVVSKALPDGTPEQQGTKALLLASEYIRGAPRSLKAHTTISERTTSKTPESVAKLQPGAGASSSAAAAN